MAELFFTVKVELIAHGAAAPLWRRAGSRRPRAAAPLAGDDRDVRGSSRRLRLHRYG